MHAPRFLTSILTAGLATATLCTMALPARAQLAGNTLPTQSDNKFAQAAIAGGNQEIDQAHAQLKSIDRSVRLFAKDMIRDHGYINAQIAALTKGAGFKIPKQIGGTGAKLPAQAPQAYMQQQVTEHQQAIALFNKELKNGSRQYQAMMQYLLPLLYDHLKMAQQYVATGKVTQEVTPKPSTP